MAVDSVPISLSRKMEICISFGAMILKHPLFFFAMVHLTIPFVLLTCFVVQCPGNNLDSWITAAVQQCSSPLSDHIMRLISFGESTRIGLVLIISLALSLWLARYKREAHFVLWILATGPVLYLLKHAINRPRPAGDLIRTLESSSSPSFPSGSVMFYVVFFGFLFCLMTSLTKISGLFRLTVCCVCALLITSISYARIYLGAHWFTDTLGGLLLGLICLLTLCFFYFRNDQR